MFSLENELEKRLQIVADRDVLNERKTQLEAELQLVNEKLAVHDYAEIDNEIAEIKKLMGIEDEVVEETDGEVVAEQNVEVVE